VETGSKEIAAKAFKEENSTGTFICSDWVNTGVQALATRINP
jgi:hypothetical protein